MKNEEYTDSWISDFDSDDVAQYAQKFISRWEKNIKHRQQVAFIRKYLKPDTYWCDCPIGSGRLMDALHTSRMAGIDKSPAFLEYNKAKGISCFEGDLLDLPFENEFDLVTSMHTIFAFDQHEDVLKQYMKMLRPGGLLIIDIVNQSNIERLGPLEQYPYKSYMHRDRIESFFASLGHEVKAIKPHDFWDSASINKWQRGGSPFSKQCKHVVWRIMQRAYQWLHLYPLLTSIEKLMPEDRFVKYLVVVQKGEEDQ